MIQFNPDPGFVGTERIIIQRRWVGKMWVSAPGVWICDFHVDSVNIRGTGCSRLNALENAVGNAISQVNQLQSIIKELQPHLVEMNSFEEEHNVY